MSAEFRWNILNIIDMSTWYTDIRNCNSNVFSWKVCLNVLRCVKFDIVLLNVGNNDEIAAESLFEFGKSNLFATLDFQQILETHRFRENFAKAIR